MGSPPRRMHGVRGNSSQVGFGSEQGVDNIGSYWFYCNASNGFGQKCLLCTTDLSHVTVFRGGLRGALSSGGIEEGNCLVSGGRGDHEVSSRPLLRVPPSRLLAILGLPQWRGEKSTRDSSTPSEGRAPRARGPGIAGGLLTEPILLPGSALFSRRITSRRLLIMRSSCAARSCCSRWCRNNHRAARTTIAATPKTTAPA